MIRSLATIRLKSFYEEENEDIDDGEHTKLNVISFEMTLLFTGLTYYKELMYDAARIVCPLTNLCLYIKTHEFESHT